MGKDYSRQELEEMQAEFESLPIGYISRKKISGKEYFYRQWAEDGKTKSQYIKKKDLETVRSQIERRKELQSILKQSAGNRKFSAYDVKDVRNTEVHGIPEAEEKTLQFETEVQTGVLLERLTAGVSDYSERHVVRKLEDYLGSWEDDRLCFLFGLRRTGKTTMIYQVINRLNEREKNRTAYIRVGEQDKSQALMRDIRKLAAMEYHYLFIDEMTACQNFSEMMEMLSDVYGKMGMKIVISGMNPAGKLKPVQGSFYDRADILRTTHISYREYCRLMGNTPTEDYLRTGGILRSGGVWGDETDNIHYQSEYIRDYVECVICENLGQEQADIIYEKIWEWNEERIIRILSHDFKLYNWREAAVRKRSGHMLAEGEKKTVLSYLKELDLYDEYVVWDIQQGENKKKMSGLFTLPWINFSQVKQTLDRMMEDSYFAGLSERDKRLIRDRITATAMKRMLVEIVILETQRERRGTYNVCSLNVENAEYDMLVYDARSDECWIYIISYSENTDLDLEKKMLDDENRRCIERQFGRIIDRSILYLGEEQWTENGIHYQNAGIYLGGLGRKNVV